MVAHHTLSGVVAERGFAFVRGLSPDASTLKAVTKLGAVDVVEGLAPIQALVPMEVSQAPPNTYSGNFGMSAFPLHTDLAHWATPPRFLALRCVSGSAAVATRVLDGQALINRFGLRSLRRALVHSRRPIQNRKQLFPLLERLSEDAPHRLRWDSIYLRPASEAASAIFEEISIFLATTKAEEFRLLEAGDTLIIDNWRCLHGRSAVSEHSIRKIERAYLRSIT
jgi:L-asparagine oxygenase